MPVFTLFGQPANFTTLASDTSNYTMGVQFSTSDATSTLTAVWFFSPPGATVLPQNIALYQVSGASLIMSQAASWSGAAGSGWVRAPVTSPPALTAGTSYKACIQETGGGGNFYGTIANYWSSGPGSGGISSGPLTAPNNAGGDGGQDTFVVSIPLAYPNSSFNATNYGMDPEVTTVSAPPVNQPIPGDQMTASGGSLYAATWDRYPIKRGGTS